MRSHRVFGKRAAKACAFAAAGLVASAMAADDTFPSRAISIVVPSEAGSGPDALARLVSPRMSKELGKPVVVENRAGAAGNIGATLVGRAPADGHTLLMMATVHTISASVLPAPGYSPVHSFVPVGMVSTAALVLVGPASAGAGTLKDLIAQAKSRPGALNFATPGLGSIQHLATEMLARKAGVTMTHVPYKSGAAAALSAASGETQLAFVSIPVALPLLKSGKLVAYGVSSAAPSESLPGVPTIGNALGFDFQVENWFALVAPAGTPESIVRRLNASLNEALGNAQVREQFAKLGSPAQPSTPAKLGQDIARETAEWKKVVDAANIRFKD